MSCDIAGAKQVPSNILLVGSLRSMDVANRRARVVIEGPACGCGTVDQQPGTMYDVVGLG